MVIDRIRLKQNSSDLVGSISLHIFILESEKTRSQVLKYAALSDIIDVCLWVNDSVLLLDELFKILSLGDSVYNGILLM